MRFRRAVLGSAQLDVAVSWLSNLASVDVFLDFWS